MKKSTWGWILGVAVILYVGYSLWAGNWTLKKPATL